MRTIFFDTDPGVDDALALLFLHRHPQIELCGITTVAGNGTLEAVTRNALYFAERFHIMTPVARGAAAPLEGELRPPPVVIHGENALGDVPIPSRLRPSLDARPAHRFIIDAVRERPGEITILAVGMLTNLAHAILEDPESSRSFETSSSWAVPLEPTDITATSARRPRQTPSAIRTPPTSYVWPCGR